MAMAGNERNRSWAELFFLFFRRPDPIYFDDFLFQLCFIYIDESSFQAFNMKLSDGGRELIMKRDPDERSSLS